MAEQSGTEDIDEDIIRSGSEIEESIKESMQ